MNKIKLHMDNYFNGLNLPLIRHQISTYGNLVKVVDETTLTDLVNCINGELNVKYEDENMGIAMGFLNDYVNGEIGERTLLHCLTGACDRYSRELPNEVLEVSYSVLTSIYNTASTGEDESGCNCKDCSCGKKEVEEEATYNLQAIINGILKGDTTIMDGSVKVPCEVVLSVANFMDKTGLDEKGFASAMAKGIFKGEVVTSPTSVSINLAKPENEDKAEHEPKQTLIDKEAIRKAMKDTEKEKPGAFERMKKASNALEEIGVDVEGMLIKLVLEKANDEGVSMTSAEAKAIVKAVMNGSI